MRRSESADTAPAVPDPPRRVQLAAVAVGALLATIGFLLMFATGHDVVGAVLAVGGFLLMFVVVGPFSLP